MMIYICLYNSPKYGGGVEQVVGNLIKNFSQEMLKNITLVCNDVNEKDNFNYNGIKCINLITKRYYVLDKLFILSRILYSLKIYNFLKNNTHNGDIINIHGIEYSLFPSILKHSIPQKIKLIVTTHGSFFESYNNYVVKELPWMFFYIKIFFFFWRYYFFLLEKLEVKNIDYFIHINKYFKNYYINNYKLDINNNIIIYNGVNLKNKYKKKLKNDSKFTAIIIGSNIYGKGLDIAIKTINILNQKGYDIKLTIVGFSDFYKRYKKEQIPKFINYIGRVSPNEVNKYLQESDFLFFPSRSEGFPLTVLESLQNGLPIIVSKNCKTEEIEGYNGCGYIANNYQVATFVKLCENMMNLHNYNIFVKNINNLNLSKFDWKNISLEYENFFNNIINKNDK